MTLVSGSAISAPFIIDGEKLGGRHDSLDLPDTPPQRTGRSPSASKLPCQTLPLLPGLRAMYPHPSPPRGSSDDGP